MSKIVEEINKHREGQIFDETTGFLADKSFIFAKRITSQTKTLLRLNQPYMADNGRILHVVHGEATYTINLVEYNICQGDLIIIPPNSIVEVNSNSESYTLQAITLPNVIPNSTINLHPESESILIKLNSLDAKLINNYFDLIWQVIKSEGYQFNLINTLAEALYQNVMLLHNKQSSQNTEKKIKGKSLLIKKFFALVTQHGVEERTIAFYAKELCVSNCYLSIIVKQETGNSVMHWINRIIIYRAKVILEYSDKNITEIADDLDFSTSSFFCKFFKNATGITPTQYRNTHV